MTRRTSTLRSAFLTALIAALPTLVRAAAAASAVADADIRDIRGPKYLMPAWLWPAVAAGVILLAAAIYGIWHWRRRRERVLLHFELALKRLEEIRSLMRPQHAREFSTAVSDIVRTYIEQRFDVTATHRTTEEFLHDLLESSNSTLAKHRALLSEFLHQCDLVKFAGMSLTTRSMESLHRSAGVFVQETAKPEEPPKPDAPSKPGDPPPRDKLIAPSISSAPSSPLKPGLSPKREASPAK